MSYADLTESWRLHYRRIAPSLVALLAAQGVSRPADAVVPLFLEAARRLDRFEGMPRALRAWVFVLAHRSVANARRHVDDARIAGPMLLDPLSSPERDVLLLRLLAGLSVDQVAVVVSKRRRSVLKLQRRAIEVLLDVVVGQTRPISDEDIATLLAGDDFPSDQSLLPLASTFEGLRADLIHPAPTHIEDQHLAALTMQRTQAPATPF